MNALSCFGSKTQTESLLSQAESLLTYSHHPAVLPLHPQLSVRHVLLGKIKTVHSIFAIYI